MEESKAVTVADSAKDAEKKTLALGDRMKSYEAQTVQHLNPHLPFIIRLDGKSCF
jgi:hypothetical protein